MRQAILKTLAWALALDPATLKWLAAVLVALCFGLVLFGLVQYQAFNRDWGLHLVLGLAGGAVVAGLGAAIHWLLGVLYGVGYLLTWLAWVLTRRWPGWRQRLVRSGVAAMTLGPWLCFGATEKAGLTPFKNPSDKAEWLAGSMGYGLAFMLPGIAWIAVLVAGWGCWRSAPAPKLSVSRRWALVAWALAIALGLNWYLAGRVDVLAVSHQGQHWRLAHVLLSRPGSVRYRDFSGYAPLHLAVAKGHADAVRLLLAAGADVNAKGNMGRTPLHRAAVEGPEIVRLLLAAGADGNAKAKDGQTPLHWAAVYGDATAVRLLLEGGADVNAKRNDGETPLHGAADNGRAAAVRLLLATGAEVNARDGAGGTPLDRAVDTGHDEIVRLLLAAGAEVNTRDKDGETPLHRAASRSKTEIVRLLLDGGADVNVKDWDGRATLHGAAAYGNADVVRLLLAAGANNC